MRLICRWSIGFVIVCLFSANAYSCVENPPLIQQNVKEENAMTTGATSPSGAIHPGQILFEDRVDNRQWTKQAAEVPQTIAWVNVEGVWHPVIRIEITGTIDQRRITKYGQNNEFLETTIQSPPPQAEPEPEPIPTPRRSDK